MDSFSPLFSKRLGICYLIQPAEVQGDSSVKQAVDGYT